MTHVGEEEMLNLETGTSVFNQRKECVRKEVRCIVSVFSLESGIAGSFQVPVRITLSAGVSLNFHRETNYFSAFT